MVKWIFALLVLSSAGAQANGLAQHTSGCVILNEIIYEEVTASGWGITGADLVFTNFREPTAVICTGATQAASAEYSRATQTTGNTVTRQSGVGRLSSSGGEVPVSTYGPRHSE